MTTWEDFAWEVFMDEYYKPGTGQNAYAWAVFRAQYRAAWIWWCDPEQAVMP